MDTNAITAGDYGKSFEEHGESPKALLWGNYKIAAVRYKELVTDLAIEGRSILDAGCGMGDLIPFLYAKSANFNYLGVDTNAKFVEIGRKRYEGHNFKIADPFTEDIRHFDIVITSGVLNGNVENWLELRKKSITSLFEIADEALAFNMSGSFKPIPNTPITAFADLQEILAFCSTLTPRIIVRGHYSGRGFTIIMFK